MSMFNMVPYDLSIGNGFEFSVMRNEITIHSDFDAPLPEDMLVLFEGGESMVVAVN